MAVDFSEIERQINVSHLRLLVRLFTKPITYFL